MDLFSRIAVQRLGQAPALRPALAPHYAPRVGVGDAASAATLEVSEDLAATARPAAAATGRPMREAMTTAPRALPGAQHEPTRPAPHEVSAATRPAAASAPARSESRWRDTATRPADNAASRAGAALHAAAAPLPPARHDAARLFAARESSITTNTPDVNAAAPRRGPDHSAQAPLRPPLEASRLDLLRAPSATTRAPVVHVHIDRIEVRAPAVPPKTPPATRARPAPSNTLADYLRGSGNGRGASK